MKQCRPRPLLPVFRTFKEHHGSFHAVFNTLRIDYVLSGGLEPISYETLPVEFSDHHPVVVRLKKTEKD